jgi:hypothetical protein
MTPEHASPAVLERLFDPARGAPLGVEEFDELHRHLSVCSDCRSAFEGERQRSLRDAEVMRDADVLTEGQVATILNVVLERGRRVEAAGAVPVASSRAARASRRRWRPLAWGLTGALAAVCAGLVLMPASGLRRGTWAVRGAGDASPSRDLFCYDERTQSATPLPETRAACAPGNKISLEARSLRGFGWVSVVACDRASCRLIDSQRAEGPSVSLFGPTVEASGAWTVFTIWSGASVEQRDVDRAVEVIKARGGHPNAVDSLSLGQSSKQLVAVVGTSPPS